MEKDLTLYPSSVNSKYTKRSKALLVIREMEIKTIWDTPYIPTYANDTD